MTEFENTNNQRKQAYAFVLNELTQCGMFRGIYDAKNGSRDFANGILCVMEAIAYGVDDNTGNHFETMFLENVLESEEKVKIVVDNE